MNKDRYKMRALLCVLLFCPLLANIPVGSAVADGQVSMQSLEGKIERQFEDVANMIPEQFEVLRSKQPGDIVLFDVREPDEFEVSHLPGALRVDPGIGREEFMKTFAGNMKDKTVVFYCSVGYRSSRLAARIQERLKELGAKGVYNLRGGIFAWRNAGRVMVKDGSQTAYIHPYNKAWSRYLNSSDNVSYGKQRAWWQWQ